MLKKVLWTLPVLVVGMAIGGLALPHAFAFNTMPPGHQQMMQQAMITSQGQAMLQACNTFMGQFGQAQK